MTEARGERAGPDTAGGGRSTTHGNPTSSRGTAAPAGGAASPEAGPEASQASGDLALKAAIGRVLAGMQADAHAPDGDDFVALVGAAEDRLRQEAIAGRGGDPAVHLREAVVSATSGPPVLRSGVELPLWWPGRPEDSNRIGLAETLASFGPRRAADAPRRSAAAVTDDDRAESARTLAAGRQARAAGRLLRAAAGIRRASELDPESVVIHRELARTYALIGNDRLAGRAWSDVAALAPGDLEASVELAREAMAANRPLPALSLLRGPLERRLAASPVGAAPLAEAGAEAGAGADGASAVTDLDVVRLAIAAGVRLGRPAVVRDAVRLVIGPRDIDGAHPELRLVAGDAAMQLGDVAGAADWYAGTIVNPETVRPRVARPDRDAARPDADRGPASAPRLEAAVRLAALRSAAARPEAAWRALLDALRTDDPWTAAATRAVVSNEAVRAGAGLDRPPGVYAVAAAVAWAARGELDDDRVESRHAFDPALGRRRASDGLPVRLMAAAGDLSPGPSRRLGRRADRGSLPSVPWVHPLPDVADAAGVVLTQLGRPLTGEAVDAALSVLAEAADGAGAPGDSGAADAAVLLAAMVEETGHVGRAHAISVATVDRWTTAPRGHIARIRLAGRLRDRTAIHAAVRAAVAAGWGTADLARLAAPHGDAPLTAPATVAFGLAPDAVQAWRELVGVTTASAWAATERLDASRALVKRLADRPVSGAGGDPTVAAIGLALAAVRAETGTLAASGAGRETLVDAVRVAMGVASEDPRRTVAWDLVEGLLGSAGPLADPASLARQRRRRAAVAPNDPLVIARARRPAPGAPDDPAARHEAARQRLMVTPGDRFALDDLVRAAGDLGGPEVAIERLDVLAADAPGDPVPAALRLRIEAESGRIDSVRAWLDARLAARPDDLVALRLSEAAAGLAGDAMMRLVLGEERLMQRPSSPARDLDLARLARDAGQERDAIAALDRVIDGAAAAIDRDLYATAETIRQMAADEARWTQVRLGEAVASRPAPARIPDDLAGLGLVPLARAAAGDLELPVTGDAATARFDALVATMVDRGTSRTGDAVQRVDPWRTHAQRLVDAGRPDYAVRALLARLAAVTGDPPASRAALASMAVAADAATLRGAEASGRPIPSAAGGPVATLRALDLLEADADSLAAFAAGGAGGDGWPQVSARSPRAGALARASSMHRLAGSEPAADALLAAALALVPDDPGLLNDLGYTRMVAGPGPHPEAGRLVEQAAALAPDRATILDSLGWLRYLEGRFQPPLDPDADPRPDTAVPLLERAVAMDPAPNPEVLLHLGDARWRAGDRTGAEEAWTRGLAVLAAAQHQTRSEQAWRTLQLDAWGLLVHDPGAMYHEQFGTVAAGLRDRLDAVRRRVEPPITPTWDG